jgi:hypothetical protein
MTLRRDVDNRQALLEKEKPEFGSFGKNLRRGGVTKYG